MKIFLLIFGCHTKELRYSGNRPKYYFDVKIVDHGDEKMQVINPKNEGYRQKKCKLSSKIQMPSIKIEMIDRTKKFRSSSQI